MAFASKFEDTVSLGQGAPQFPTPSFIYEKLNERAKTDVSLGMYNSVNDKVQLPLKKLIQSEMEKQYGFVPEIEEIYLTVGGLGGLFATLMSILEKGDEVIYLDPSYPLHLSQIAVTEAKPVFVPLIEEEGWRVDIEGIRRAITKNTKAIVLTNPNNPTGTVLSESQVREIAELVLEHDIFLVLDEAYAYLTYDTPLYSPMRIEALREKIVLNRSFSKEYSMTGWRIGYLWAKQELRQKIHGIHLHFSLNPATISVVAATIALEDPRGVEAMEEFRSKITQSKGVICQRMADVAEIFDFVEPMGAFYLFPKILLPGMTAKALALRLIEEVGVITISGETMGPSGADHLRMSFAAPPEKINNAFDRLVKFQASL